MSLALGRSRPSPFLVVLALPCVTLAQGEYAHAPWEDGSVGVNGTPAWSQSVDAFRDVDGDGVRDVLVAEPVVGLGSYGGVVRLLSGRTGKELLALDQVGLARMVVNVGDVDGDGLEDFLTGGPFAIGNLYSGADGSFLRSVPSTTPGIGNIHAGRMPDLNGDGRAELLIGNSDAFAYRVGCCSWFYQDDGERRVWLLDGRTGALLLEILPPSSANYGTVLGAVDDVDGDGLADIGVGAGIFDHMGLNPLAMPSSIGFDVYSSANGQLLWTVATTVTEFELLDDLNGDGIGDLALGGRIDGSSSLCTIELRSGSDGTLLRTLNGRSTVDGFGYSLATEDWDGDGDLDLIVGAHEFAGITSSYGGTFIHDADGYVQVVDPSSGTILQTFDGSPSDWGLGAAVVAIGDATGDGLPDLGALAPGSDVLTGGAYRVLSQAPLRITTDTNTIPHASGGSQTFTTELGPANAGRIAFLFGSASGPTPGVTIGGTTIPLVPDLYTALLAPLLVPVVLDANGSAAVTLTVPGNFGGPGFAGTVLDHAFVVIDPATISVVDASWSLPTVFLPTSGPPTD